MARRAVRTKKLNRLMTLEPTATTSLFLPVSLLKRVQTAARRLNWSQAEIHRQALEAWFAAHPALAAAPRRATR
jgi:hypothetical protein